MLMRLIFCSTGPVRRHVTRRLPELPDASPVPHPTVKWIQTEIMDIIDEDLKNLGPPEAYAGISAFDSTSYVNAMKQFSEYECNVCISDHKLWAFEISGIYPAIGSILRMSTKVFWDPVKNTYKACWPVAIPVRALSPAEAPSGGLERLHYSAALFGFLYSWAQAKKAGDSEVATEFARFARRCRTRFILAPDEDDAKRRKWILSEQSDIIADNAGPMVGYKRTLGVADVTSGLVSRGQPADAAAVAAWFNSVTFSQDEDRITPKVVQAYNRIYNRLKGHNDIVARLDQIESHFNRKHVFAGTVFLDQLCGKHASQRTSRCKDRCCCGASKACLS